MAPGFLWIIVPLWCYLLLVVFILSAVPGSFSAGEAVLVSQGVFLLGFDVGLQTIRQVGDGMPFAVPNPLTVCIDNLFLEAVSIVNRSLSQALLTSLS